MQQSGLPMFYKNDPSTISDQIVWMVKNSQLNFQVQETAYSLNIQIKKRFLKDWNEVQNKNNIEQSLKVKVNIFEIERGILLSEIDKLRSKDIKISSQLGESEAPVKTKKQKKKNIKLNSSASDFTEGVSDENMEEVSYLEPNVPTSNMFQKLEDLNDDEFAIFSVEDHHDKYPREISTQQINSSQDESYTPPGTPPIRELAVQTTATDTNNNNSTDEPCSAADTLQELIAKNLRRLKAKM